MNLRPGFFLALLVLVLRSPAHAGPVPEDLLRKVFAEEAAGLVLLDCGTGEATVYNEALSSQPLPPCSTFKIWNTLIGLETGLLQSPDDAFYTWDGVVRFLPEWNRDLTLREAFQASCVPAFQQLARRIGTERMQEWIAKLGYGNGDLSAGLDVFWLPAAGRTTLLITAREQAELLCKLNRGELPCSAHALDVLRAVMAVKTSEHGRLFGKTGSGTLTVADRATSLGWFAGFVESGGQTWSFACVLRGGEVSGKDARAKVIALLEQLQLL